MFLLEMIYSETTVAKKANGSLLFIPLQVCGETFSSHLLLLQNVEAKMKSNWKNRFLIKLNLCQRMQTAKHRRMALRQPREHVSPCKEVRTLRFTDSQNFSTRRDLSHLFQIYHVLMRRQMPRMLDKPKAQLAVSMLSIVNAETEQKQAFARPYVAAISLPRIPPKPSRQRRNEKGQTGHASSTNLRTEEVIKAQALASKLPTVTYIELTSLLSHIIKERRDTPQKQVVPTAGSPGPPHHTQCRSAADTAPSQTI